LGVVFLFGLQKHPASGVFHFELPVFCFDQLFLDDAAFSATAMLPTHQFDGDWAFDARNA
jgi:hypothetical protein